MTLCLSFALGLPVPLHLAALGAVITFPFLATLPRCDEEKTVITIIDLMTDPALLGRWFRGSSWNAWKVFLKGIFALPMTEEEFKIFQKHTGCSKRPREPVREAWVIAGRRAGKSLIAALVAVFLACFKTYAVYLAPGEVVTIMVISADRRQSRTIMRYVIGFLDSVPMLKAMVVKRTTESVELTNGVVIEIHTATFRGTRGYTLAAVVCDEIAYWRNEESANPDVEIINGLRPALATIPGSLLLAISSPYARRGAMWQAYSKHFGKD